MGSAYIESQHFAAPLTPKLCSESERLGLAHTRRLHGLQKRGGAGGEREERSKVCDARVCVGMSSFFGSTFVRSPGPQIGQRA